jgi:hypothetical protein
MVFPDVFKMMVKVFEGPSRRWENSVASKPVRLQRSGNVRPKSHSKFVESG